MIEDILKEGHDVSVAFWDHASQDLKKLIGARFFSLNKWHDHLRYLQATGFEEPRKQQMSKSPSKATVKRLFALSGNRCAFPGCGRPIVDPETGNLTGGIVHIRGASPCGARYDQSQTDEQRQSVENLLILCYDHHFEIDAHSDKYSADFLLGVKAANEGHIRKGKEPSEEVAGALLTTISENRVSDGSVIISEKQTGGQVAHSIINVGPNAWGDSLPREDQLVFRSYDFVARYMGRDSAGGQAQVKRTDVMWIEFWFKIEIFNSRSVNVGLMDIFVVFAKGDEILLQVVPGIPTGRLVAGSLECPPANSMNLPSHQWTKETCHGTLWHDRITAVDGCDDIFLIAKTVDGFAYKCPLGNGIQEKQ